MQSKQKAGIRQLPMMPIRDVVIFPHMMTPFVVGRESSVLALEEALNTEKKIFLATQHDASIDDPTPDQIYQVGTIVSIVQSLKLPDGNIKVLVEGVERARLHTVTQQEGFYRATVKVSPARPVPSEKTEALNSRVTSSFEHYVKQSQNLNYETMIAAVRVDDPGKLADTVGANLQLTIPEKQDLLEIFDPIDRLTRVAEVLDIELEKLNVDRTIQNRVKRQMEKAQKEYYLNEKIKAIQKELGKGEKGEYEELRKKIEDAGMTKDAKEKSLTELKRLENMPPMSAESTVSRNYIDWLLAVPWKKKSREIRDLGFAEKVLNEDHYGLEKVKERIPGISGRAPADQGTARLDPVLCRPPRGREDVAGQVYRAVDGPQVHPPVSRRRARRSRNPWAPPYLHRGPARADHPDDEEGRHYEPCLHAR